MIDKEVERQIAFLHAAYGLIAGIVLGLYHKSDVLPFLNVLIWGFIVSYPVMIVSKKTFKLSAEDFTVKAWLGKGFFYFFTVWMVVWAFVYNVG